MKALLFLLLLLIAHSGYTQYEDYENYIFDWEPHPPERDIPINPEFADDDAIILKERNEFKVNQLQTRFVNVYIERDLLVKINSKKGRDSFSEFLLPEPLDLHYDCTYLPLAERAENCAMTYFNTRIVYFAIRILRENGEIIYPQIHSRQHLQPLKINLEFHNAFLYDFSMDDIQVGDLIEVHYKIEVPYAENWMRFHDARVFFNGRFPKQDYTFLFNVHKRLDWEIDGTEAQSTDSTGQRIIRTWNYKNLKGNIYEQNARPHLELPHIIYSLKTQSERFKIPYTLSGEYLPSTFWRYTLLIREYNFFWLQRLERRNIIIDRQSKLLKEFIEDATYDIPDNRPVEKLMAIHNKINADFEYRNDWAYYNLFDRSLAKLGDEVENKELRDISRYNLYARLINGLDLQYFTAYFIDKRVASPGEEFMGNIYFHPYAFVLPGENSEAFIFPKSDRYGLQFNELPFYLEDNSYLLVDYTKLAGDLPGKPKFPKTPSSDEKVNRRVSKTDVYPSKDEESLNFRSDLLLSGQFSTILREYYLYGESDSTIAEYYYTPLYAIGQNVQLNKNKMNSFTEEFPFESTFNFGYQQDLDLSGDTLTLDLNNLFAFPTPDNFDAEKRSLDFYPDFKFNDIYEINLNFSNSHQFLDVESLETSLKNAYGSYQVQVKEINSGYKITFSWLQTADVIPKEKATEIEAMINAINQEKIIHLVTKKALQN